MEVGVSYQTTNEDVTAAFETARHHLKPGGIFIFDVWYGPAVLTQRPEVRIKRMADDQTEITRLAEPVLHPNENRVDVHYHVFVRDLATQAVAELEETHNLPFPQDGKDVCRFDLALHPFSLPNAVKNKCSPCKQV